MSKEQVRQRYAKIIAAEMTKRNLMVLGALTKGLPVEGKPIDIWDMNFMREYELFDLKISEITEDEHGTRKAIIAGEIPEIAHEVFTIAADRYFPISESSDPPARENNFDYLQPYEICTCGWCGKRGIYGYSEYDQYCGNGNCRGARSSTYDNDCIGTASHRDVEVSPHEARSIDRALREAYDY